MNKIANADRVLIEWDWVVVGGRGKRLHYPIYVDWDEETSGTGYTVCGIYGDQFIPGLFTRMGAMRCQVCCRKLGYPQGKGSPKNDAKCRTLVEARLAMTPDEEGSEQ